MQCLPFSGTEAHFGSQLFASTEFLSFFQPGVLVGSLSASSEVHVYKGLFARGYILTFQFLRFLFFAGMMRTGIRELSTFDLFTATA
jgi:hypothetical protein